MFNLASFLHIAGVADRMRDVDSCYWLNYFTNPLNLKMVAD